MGNSNNLAACNIHTYNICELRSIGLDPALSLAVKSPELVALITFYMNYSHNIDYKSTVQPGHSVTAALADKKGLPQMERKMTAEPLIQQKCQTPSTMLLLAKL